MTTQADCVLGPHGQLQRFCQQCGRFHDLDMFDGSKRSCRQRLAQHNTSRKRRLNAIKARAAAQASTATAQSEGAATEVETWALGAGNWAAGGSVSHALNMYRSPAQSWGLTEPSSDQLALVASSGHNKQEQQQEGQQRRQRSRQPQQPLSTLSMQPSSAWGLGGSPNRSPNSCGSQVAAAGILSLAQQRVAPASVPSPFAAAAQSAQWAGGLGSSAPRSWQGCPTAQGEHLMQNALSVPGSMLYIADEGWLQAPSPSPAPSSSTLGIDLLGGGYTLQSNRRSADSQGTAFEQLNLAHTGALSRQAPRPSSWPTAHGQMIPSHLCTAIPLQVTPIMCFRPDVQDQAQSIAAAKLARSGKGMGIMPGRDLALERLATAPAAQHQLQQVDTHQPGRSTWQFQLCTGKPVLAHETPSQACALGGDCTIESLWADLQL